MRRQPPIATLVAVLFLASSSVGQELSREEVADLYDRATKLAEAGKFDEAKPLYLRLWNHRRTYDTAFNLAEIAFKNGDYAAAADYAQYGLKQFPPSENPKLREHFEELFADACAEVGQVAITAPTGATIWVDNRAVGKAPVWDVFVVPGQHSFEATLDDAVSAQDITVAKGDKATVTLTFDSEQEPTVPPPPPTATPDPVQDTTPTRERRGPAIAPIAIGSAVALVGLGVGTGFALRASAKRDEARELDRKLPGDSQCASGAPATSDCRELDELWSARDSAVNISAWSFAVGGAAAAATLTYALWPRPRREMAINVSPTLTGLRLRGRF